MSFGLDIGSQSIKVVELAREGSKWRLIAAGIGATPPSGMVLESDRTLLEVSQAVKKLVTDAKITTKDVVVALPEQQVYTRLVPFPPLTDTEIASAVEWQIEGYIPIPKKDAIYDHQIVERGEKEVQVLLIAAPRAVVNKYTKVVEFAGLTPVAVETELVALSRSIAPRDKRTLVIDFGASSTDAAVCVSGELMLSRSIPTAGEALTRAVGQGIGVARPQAEEYKRVYGLKEKELEGKVESSIYPVVLFVIDELKKLIAYWISEHNDQPIETAVVAGGSAGLPALVPLLAEKLGIEVNIGDPFLPVLRDERTSHALAPYAPLYAIAVGLAMRT